MLWPRPVCSAELDRHFLPVSSTVNARLSLTLRTADQMREIFTLYTLAALTFLLISFPAHAQTEDAQDDARLRERDAEEDPLAQRQADRVDRYDEWEDEPSDVELYGSARVRYNAQSGNSGWNDGGSRLGLHGQWQFRPRSWLFGAAEAGFNLSDQLDQLLNPKARSGDPDEDVFLRLGYVGLEIPDLIAVFGKNWSTYYQIASFTDRFDSTGGSASGAFNAGTDGGNTGTGRADRTLQSRLLFDWLPESKGVEPFNLNIQFQHGEPIPEVESEDYGTAFGISATLRLLNDYTVGLAYNLADIKDKSDPRVHAAGIDGNAEAFLIGTRWYDEKWYFGLILSRLQNQETTDEGIYFDGWGSELYGSYNLANQLWLTAGYNYLRPDRDERHAGDYLINYGIIGTRYTFRNLERMVYFEMTINNSRSHDGSENGNVYSVGVRWDIP